MSRSPSRRFVSCLLVASLAFLAVSPRMLASGFVQEGKWKVTTNDPIQILYLNASGAAQQVVVTVCVSGGEVNFFTAIGPFFMIAPDCTTIGTSIAPAGNTHVVLIDGVTSASGTYQVTVNP